jgi:ATP-dependent RNA helicase SUPV3L1/SUV3
MNQFSPRRALERQVRARGVTAVLGPTNTGKTHYAIERMLAHPTGAIGLPLRLLAREVYNRVVEKAGPEAVALITGEEKIKPERPRYWVSTVEAMPRDLDVAFVAIDEAQLGADLDRGHVFTDRLLNRRGREETLLIGSGVARPLIEKLIPGVHVVERPRLSRLTFAGDRKLTRLPRRSAIVAFSAEDVYAIAEVIRRQKGGAAVVLGGLSPRTRNAQVDLYQNGEVDYLVATDAIGMGLNLDVDHVAFAADRKFDGWQHRRLTPAEMGQIAGRAGRNQRDGTFGTSGRCPPFEEELIEALEDHRFDPLIQFQYRNSDLDFSSIPALQRTLERLPGEEGLTRAPLNIDVMTLDMAAHDEWVARHTRTGADVARLWEACQIPDYRKVSPAAHADLALTIYRFVVRAGRIPDAWFADQLDAADRIEGDIDALSRRLAQVRTWAYVANRPDWVHDPAHWQGAARQVEDRLSDALHERLAQRFVDRRTSVLLRRLREKQMLDAEITAGGDVTVEGQHVGQLQGFRFTADPQASGEAAKALNAAAQKALSGEIEARAERVHQAVDDAFALANDGAIRWLGEVVGKLGPGDKLLEPRVQVLADEQLSGPALEKVQTRLNTWLAQAVQKRLGPLAELEKGEGLDGAARGIAFQIAESLGVLDRARVAEEVRGLDQDARAALRKLGVRFGAYHLYLPALLKPAPRALAAQLWALKHGGVEAMKGFDEAPHLAASGRTSFAVAAEANKALYRAAGFRVGGGRAVRVDILERLADLIRPAIAYRPGVTAGTPPPGAADGDGFVVTVAMTSLAGCSGEDFAEILKSLGYAVEKRKGPAITVPLLAAAPTEPLKPVAAQAGEAAGEGTSESEGAQADAPVEAVTEAQADAAVAEASEEAAPEAVTEQAAPVAEAAPAEEEAPAAETRDAPAVETAVESESAAPESEAAPASEATAENAEAVATADAEAAAEPAEETPIEVWRPHRHHHGRRPHHEHGRRHDGPRQEGGGHRGPRPAQAGAEGAPAQGEGGERPPRGRPQGGRPDKREGEGRRFEGRRPDGPRGEGRGPRPEGRPDRPQGGPPREGRGGGEWRGNREGRGPRRPERPERNFSTEAPRGRDRQPDPDSPFAKLAALKARLEGKDGE